LSNTLHAINTTFKNDVCKGLSATHKYLDSKYFYDEIGDDLFIQIMNMPEYYLTRAEFYIFKHKTQHLIQALGVHPETHFDVIELGAGDGTKTKALLEVLHHTNFKFSYLPVDISANALSILKHNITKALPEVSIYPQEGDYFNILKDIKRTKTPKVVLFLGSNIGNLTDLEAKGFISKLSAALNPKDKVILGTDLIKSKSIVLPAYSDAAGITKQFNLNILHRINKELQGNFNIDAFVHEAEYTEEEGIAKSFLKSIKTQSVYVEALEKTFHFNKGERIHTEISRKYNDTILAEILEGSSLKITDKLTDSNGVFADYILEKV
jgi:dimethylhistidine N-methyltransferase